MPRKLDVAKHLRILRESGTVIAAAIKLRQADIFDVADALVDIARACGISMAVLAKRSAVRMVQRMHETEEASRGTN